MGSSESIGGFTDLFTPLDRKWKLYERKGDFLPLLQTPHSTAPRDVSQRRLQTTIEELETSNEELKSANEELQSTNEGTLQLMSLKRRVINGTFA